MARTKSRFVTQTIGTTVSSATASSSQETV
jgi:hypothetical protein